ncbi:hypothetical protein Kpol_1018p158 [Vanderwaltozyma polyspora DSM 70294]|uniref:Phosphoglycerate mutase n=1 Tax=Vanderwaltozyma polyspora (strain ATCC 22028 / DSM 70294 / BCRC 21397 / CBS 2163 / NBRC 10782 / NRRL Y-8283 / UCD 57-17) TaxID=436907 RepID=A7TDZ9_VANPO|nr:uncharacterized protein Kpol_1018p158 [Vanderwaltozyma polyspora DSM 70294]EDO19619.1 hypothetical protein Kpol_1018p158 [Vanderwaltozyma polyspora DSM 70294]
MTVGTENSAFKALPGYFRAYAKREDESVDSTEVNHLELLQNDSWRDLYESLPEDTDTHHYKLVVFARHGQGYHNAAIERYGEDVWNAKWALLDGDEYGNWVDSKLTPVGKKQVQTTGVNVLYPLTREIGFQPHAFFSSPMRRCLETFAESWNACFQQLSQESYEETIRVKILENMRETLGRHTCDKRVDHSTTVSEYQPYSLQSGHTIHWHFEEDYPELDQLWLSDYRETVPEMDTRVKSGLIQIFKSIGKEEKFISVTCHSGVIGSVLRNLDHPRVDNLQTGNLVVAVVEVNIEQLN